MNNDYYKWYSANKKQDEEYHQLLNDFLNQSWFDSLFGSLDFLKKYLKLKK